MIPHITNEIKDFIYSVGRKSNADVVITEIGGTTGDIESQPFLEAIRQVSLEAGRGNSLVYSRHARAVHKKLREHKSKPTQHSVKELRSMGISPDIIVMRCDRTCGRRNSPENCTFLQCETRLRDRKYYAAGTV